MESTVVSDEEKFKIRHTVFVTSTAGLAKEVSFTRVVSQKRYCCTVF